MISITNEKQDKEKLGGVAVIDSLVTPIPKQKTPKKHSKKHRGYIRGKMVNGFKYYYFCWTERKTGGIYIEKSEYLGTAELIRDKVKADV